MNNMQENEELFDESQLETDSTTLQEGTPPSAPSAFDPNQMADAIAQGLARHQQGQQTSQSEMTPEQMKQMLQVWEPDDAFVQGFFQAEDPRKALLDLRDGIMKQASTYAYLAMQSVKNELMKQFEPVLIAHQQQQNEATEKRFYDKFSNLSEYKALMPAVLQGLQAQNAQFQTEDELFTRVAQEMTKLVRAAVPNFQVLPTTSNTPSQGGAPRMASMSPGSRAGGSKGTPSGSADIWDM